MSVLVLDDSENMCSILTRLLRPFGFEDSRFAGDGQEALNHLRERSVELAIVYWHMEPLNGIDFTRQMRSMKTSPDPYLPVIHLCGFTEMERIRIAGTPGVKEILTKPVSPASFYGRLTSVVR